ncbi:hypothetical protein B0H19DRAFT_1067712 [Mycena capillaripes]|nr:hypothetical protein B0H19DRAFT_1067712 [Mycena capillaripes]
MLVSDFEILDLTISLITVLASDRERCSIPVVPSRSAPDLYGESAGNSAQMTSNQIVPITDIEGNLGQIGGNPGILPREAFPDVRSWVVVLEVVSLAIWISETKSVEGHVSYDCTMEAKLKTCQSTAGLSCVYLARSHWSHVPILRRGREYIQEEWEWDSSSPIISARVPFTSCKEWDSLQFVRSAIRPFDRCDCLGARGDPPLSTVCHFASGAIIVGALLEEDGW